MLVYFLEIWLCHHLLSESHVVYNVGEKEACDETNKIIPIYVSVHKPITPQIYHILYKAPFSTQLPNTLGKYLSEIETSQTFAKCFDISHTLAISLPYEMYTPSF